MKIRTDPRSATFSFTNGNCLMKNPGIQRELHGRKNSTRRLKTVGDWGAPEAFVFQCSGGHDALGRDVFH